MPTTLSNLIPSEISEYTDKLFPFGLASVMEQIVYDELVYTWSEQSFFALDPGDSLDESGIEHLYEPPEEFETSWLTLYFRGQLPDLLPHNPGLGDAVELVTGGAFTVSASLNVDDLTFEAWLSAEILKLRFSRDVVVPLVQDAGKYVDDPDPNAQVEIDLDVLLGVDDTGAVYFQWPEGSSERLDLPPLRLAAAQHPIIGGKLALDFSGDERGIAIRWVEPDAAAFIGRLAPGIISAGNGPMSSTLTARILFGEQDPVREVRLDWQLQNASLDLRLPGVTVTTPNNIMLSLLLGAGGRAPSWATLVMSLYESPQQEALFTVASNFAWPRDSERELQSDPTKTAAEPFVKLELKTSQAFSVALIDLDLSAHELPAFFQELLIPLQPLNFDDTQTLFESTRVDFINPLSHWSGSVLLNPGALRLPFLEQGEDNASSNQFQQWIEVKPRGTTTGSGGWIAFEIEPEKSEVEIALDLTLKFGNISFTGDIGINFNWQTMTLKVEHGSGISMATTKPEYGTTEAHLGLYWRLKGADLGNGRYEYFRIVTEHYHYQVQMAQGAAFELEYREISDDPILFTVKDFVLSPKGVDLTAEVTDRPARLNGVDTRFRFGGSRLEVKENSIKDFTLAGSGPLPPDLVGEAMVDVALQFKQVDGRLTLVAGGAQLRGEKLLDCKGTRFQFAVMAIGLKFVYENKFHIYFTLTGSAQFVLAPGDDTEGALALLPKIKIDMVECPLCGDVSVLAKHVNFLVELPKPLKFSFLKAFGFELRGFGFVPSAEVLGGVAAMELSGQVFFAQGSGDVIDARIDFHNLYIGLPRPGEFLPQLYFKELAVSLKVGEAFELNGKVAFYDTGVMKGFAGEGMLDMKGMPQFAAAFSFVRVRRDENSNWVRAWFIYLEVRKVSFMIPVVQFYLREIGLGFGYRYTIASIKVADRENDIRKLREELVKLSRTQAELAKIEAWEVDLEDPGQDPRWTIVLRAMISQNSASPGALQYSEQAEAALANLFLLDAMIAFRSDLTFYMAVRGWLNTNYHEFVTNKDNVRERPLYSGFVLLSPRRKLLFLAATSNSDGFIGDHPPLPDFVKAAIRGVHFSLTLLVQPGLVHFELGWPNKLSWQLDFSLLTVECRGGFIFRVTPDELVIGISYEARGRLQIKAEVSAGIVGVWVEALVEVGFGARVIALLPFHELAGTVVYGAVGLELRIHLTFGFWIKLLFIKKTFTFSLDVGFTAGLEMAIGIPPQINRGLRGRGTLWVAVMGHRLQVNASLGINDGFVQTALDKTQHVLNLGLEATDVGPLPGFGEVNALAFAALGFAAEAAPAPAFHLPEYTAFVIRPPQDGRSNGHGWGYLVLLPRGEHWAGDRVEMEEGFLPPPPALGVAPTADFQATFPAHDKFTMMHWNPNTQSWQPVELGTPFPWKVRWDARAFEDSDQVTVAEYLGQAFILDASVPVGDPDAGLFTTGQEPLEDSRVYNPSDNAFESAVRGAAEQFAGSPYFRLDTGNRYDSALQAAFLPSTTVYHQSGKLAFPEMGGGQVQALRETQVQAAADNNENAAQTRGLIIHDLVGDLRAYVAAASQNGGNGAPGSFPPAPGVAFADHSVPFNLGVVFAFRGDDGLPPWLVGNVAGGDLPVIKQRSSPQATAPDDTQQAAVDPFNTPDTDFRQRPPEFTRVQHYTSTNTIAITWDLTWSTRGPATGPRDDPNHHLAHYEVRRRALTGQEREVVYTVKPAEAVHREAPGPEGLLRLRPRFNVVDQWSHETAEEQATMPPDGYSYLYTITPVDFAGSRGRPLTLVATRYPSQPPFVPGNAQLRMIYERARLPDSIYARPQVTRRAREPRMRPLIVAPDRVELLNWNEAVDVRRGASVPAARFYLIFRREQTLPISSYGLDAATAAERISARPVSQARPLPTDIRVDVTSVQEDSQLLIAALQAAGVLPADPEGGAAWRPEAWFAYIQTESINGVRSALVPVQLLMRIDGPAVADGVKVSDERMLPMLEWLAQPLRFAYLPPEDQTASTGLACVPMPGEGRFTGKLDDVKYRTHPAILRAVRFRWNQTPSAEPDYPVNLNAGYHLYQLDVDAFTDETLENDRVAALRRIQEVQMVPADSLPLIPGDTLAVNQWEAWYPSDVARLPAGAATPTPGGLPVRSSWYSWRDSQLIWPACPDTMVQGAAGAGFKRLARLHPALQKLVDALRETYDVDLQLYPPDVPGDLAALVQTTAPKNDPYGWGILQRFGLSVTMELRVRNSGDLVLRQPLLAAVNAVLNRPDIIDQSLKKHLFVEILFQTGRAISLRETAIPDDGLLAIVQISLRPAIQQRLRYRRIVLHASPGATVNLGLWIPAGVFVSLRYPSQEGSGQVEIAPDDPTKPKLWRNQVIVPPGSELKFIARSGVDVDPLLLLSADEKAAVAAHAPTLEDPNLPNPPTRYLIGNLRDLPVRYVVDSSGTTGFLAVLGTIDAAQAASLTQALGGGDLMEALVRRAQTLTLEPLAPQAMEAQNFAVSDAMVDAFSSLKNPVDGATWKDFQRYAESLSGPDEPRIKVPATRDAIKAFLPQYMSWTARFFDHSGGVREEGGLAHTADGPWQAAAYPRVTTPAHAAPDEGGRLAYTQLIEEQWAHNYRYYILPYGRYDLLWQKLWESPVFAKAGVATEPAADGLTPEQMRMPNEFPDGGLDVVLDRIRPVAPPLILRSGRLDRPMQPGAAIPPGATWEVLLARHTEQAMVDRNQTLARQVAFRQVSFTLLRRFAYGSWPGALEAIVNAGGQGGQFHLALQPTETYDGADAILPPDSYPAAPDHLALTSHLSEADGISLDLPLRVPAFGQGALALQWQGLPFYYEHRLMVVAQAATVVSPVNEVTQREFEYVSPPPMASAGLRLVGDKLLELTLPLSALWESLPAEAQRMWQSEQPLADDDGSAAPRKVASLPDPEVVYQVIQTFNGNMEVQVEYLYEEKQEQGQTLRRFVARQLGKDILAGATITVVAPGADEPHGRFHLVTQLSNQSDTLEGRQIELRTRRGAAAPSSRLPLAITKGA